MKTSAQLVDEVEAELNAIAAADKGLEAIGAFAIEAEQQFDKGDVVKTKEALVNLNNLVQALRKAVPANVIPASAGSIGKSPTEQFLEHTAELSQSHLVKLEGLLPGIQDTIRKLSDIIQEASNAKVASVEGLKAAAKAREEGTLQ